jgi:uncharacterized protein (TIGR02996 family)
VDVLSSLLRAVCEDPSDDGLRLILADWLEENGEEDRGNFIRVQVELAAMGEPPNTGAEPHVGGYVCERCGAIGEHWSDRRGRACSACGTESVRKRRPFDLQHPNYEALRCRERELFGGEDDGADWTFDVREGIPPRWLRGIEPDPKMGKPYAQFRRGFIAALTLTCRDFEAHGPAIVAAAPVEAVTLADLRIDWIDREPGFNGWYAGQRPFGQLRLSAPWDAYRYFPTEEACRAAVQAAALAWAREQAGLPPLPAMVALG